MIRILYVNSNPRATLSLENSGGSAIHNYNIVRSLKGLGYEVITMFEGEGRKEQKAGSSFRKIKKWLPTSLSSMLSIIYDIYHDYRLMNKYENLVTHKNIDFIYERYSSFHQSMSKIAEKYRITYILESHSPIEKGRASSPDHFLNTARWIKMKMLQRASAVVVVSNILREFYVQKGIEESKIFVIPNGVDRNIFYPRTQEKNVRKKLAINKENTLVIGMVGRLTYWHGIELLVKAAAKIVSQAHDTIFLLIGFLKDNENKKKARNYIALKGLKRHFILLDAIPHEKIPIYLSSIDICVMPESSWNGSPIKLFEYGAMGKPVIMPDTEPIKEIIEDKVNGLLTKQGDVESLANCLLRLINDKGLRQKLGKNLQERILEHHTWERNAYSIIEIYNLIKKRS